MESTGIQSLIQVFQNSQSFLSIHIPRLQSNKHMYYNTTIDPYSRYHLATHCVSLSISLPLPLFSLSTAALDVCMLLLSVYKSTKHTYLETSEINILSSNSCLRYVVITNISYFYIHIALMYVHTHTQYKFISIIRK